MLARAEFARHVHEALSDLLNPGRLEANPLTGFDLQSSARLPGMTGAQGLRQAIHEAIEVLHPKPETPPDSPEWLAYQLLQDRYVRNASQIHTCERLGLSRATYYRRLQELGDALAGILWERYRGLNPPEAPAEVSPAERACAEAVRLARAAQPTLLHPEQVLQGALETVEPLARQQGISLHLSIPSPLPTIYGDPVALRHILLNVLTEGISLAAASVLEIAVTPERGQLHWRIAGLKPEVLAQVTGGGADGFAVSRGLLEISGGRFWLDQIASPVLHFTTPIARPEAILIIDDDSDTVSLYRRYLEIYGYRLLEARNGEQAWALLADSRPDAILLDVLMPREDGWSILQRLKTQPETAGIPVVICSVLSQPQLALALGAEVVLCKPITADMLLQALRPLLHPAGSEAPGNRAQP